MKISDSFKKAIQNTFYDKTIVLYDITTLEDDLGAEKEVFQVLEESIQSNVQTVTQDVVLKEYGSDVVGNYKITCNNIDTVKIPDANNPTQAISYEGVYFYITGVKKFDSHIEMIVKIMSKVKNG